MTPCRECGHLVDRNAVMCPGCGAPYPARDRWDGWGFEYKSSAVIGSVPFIHISFKYRPNRTPVVAKGIIAIGQFAIGLLSVGQFSLGLFSFGQFCIGLWVVAQFAMAYSCIAQFGLYVDRAWAQWSKNVFELMRDVLSFLFV